MSKLKDYPIGSVVLYKNVSLVVEGQKGNRPLCTDCYFSRAEQEKRHDRMACYKHGMACTAHTRKDKKHGFF